MHVIIRAIVGAWARGPIEADWDKYNGRIDRTTGQKAKRSVPLSRLTAQEWAKQFSSFCNQCRLHAALPKVPTLHTIVRTFPDCTIPILQLWNVSFTMSMWLSLLTKLLTYATTAFFHSDTHILIVKETFQSCKMGIVQSSGNVRSTKCWNLW